MYAVTWLFKGSKQKAVYTDIMKAEARARDLRRLGCKYVKCGPDKPKPSKPPKMWIDEALDIAQIIDVLEEGDSMADDLQDARILALKMRKNGFDKAFITQRLNDEFDPTFFATSDGIYARNEPDYLPDRLIMKCE